MRKLIATVVVALAVASPALAEESVRIFDAWARASVLASRPGAAYVTVESATEDQLLGVATPVAGQVMIHAVEKDGDISRMNTSKRLSCRPVSGSRSHPAACTSC